MIETREARLHAADPVGVFLDDLASAIEMAIETVVIPASQYKDAHTQTVELGQTPDQVKTALGAPDKVIELGLMGLRKKERLTLRVLLDVLTRLHATRCRADLRA